MEEDQLLAEIERELAELESLAATMVQRMFRNRRVRRAQMERDCARLEAQEAAELDAAATLIQRRWRGGVVRRKLWEQLGEEIAQLNDAYDHTTTPPRSVTAVRPRSLPVTPVKLPRPDRAHDDAGDSRTVVEEQLAEYCSPGVVSDCYTLGSILGTGAQSTVRRARCRATGKDYAVKSLPKSEVDLEAVLNECAIMKQLTGHPGVLQFIALYDSGQTYDLVLEHMRGGDLFGIMLESHLDRQQSPTHLPSAERTKGSAVRSEVHLPLSAEDCERAVTYVRNLVSAYDMERENALQVVQSMHVASYGPRELIIEHGEESSAFYIIRSGAVEFMRNSTLRLGSRTVGAGFGELGLLDDDHQATATAHASDAGGCTCYVLDKNHFDVLLKPMLIRDRHARNAGVSAPSGAFSNRSNEQRDDGSGFTEAEAAAFLRQIVEAVAACHSRQIVHRDLKPENILLPCISGDENFMSSTIRNLGLRLKLADFGLATVLAPHEKLDVACGTPEFVAPEVVAPSRPGYGKPADIWSIGVLLYILLCGYPPFSNINDTLHGHLEFPTAEWAGVSQEAKHLLRSLLNREPSSRPSAEELCKDLWITGRARGQNCAVVAPTTLKNMARWNAKRKLRAAFHAMVAGRRMGVLVAGLTVEKLIVDLAVHRSLTDVCALVQCFDVCHKKALTTESTMVPKNVFVQVVSREWSAGAIDRNMTPELAEQHFDALHAMEQIKAARAAIDGADTGQHVETNGECVNYLSYCLALASLLPSIDSNEKLKFAFELFDRDNSGTIDKTEFHQLLKCLLVGKCIDAKRLETILVAEYEAVDASGDGMISRDEFLVAAQGQPIMQRYFASLETIARHTRNQAVLKVQKFLRGWLVRKKYGILIRDLIARKRETTAGMKEKNPTQTLTRRNTSAPSETKFLPEPEPEPRPQPGLQPEAKKGQQEGSLERVPKSMSEAVLHIQTACRGWLARKHLAAEMQATDLKLLKELERQQMNLIRVDSIRDHRRKHSNTLPPSTSMIADTACSASDTKLAQLQEKLKLAQQEAAEMKQRAAMAESLLAQERSRNNSELKRLQEELATARTAISAAQSEATSWRTSAEVQLEVARDKTNEQAAALRSALSALENLYPRCTDLLGESSRARREAAQAREAQHSAQNDAMLLRKALSQSAHELTVTKAAVAALEERLRSVRGGQIAHAPTVAAQAPSDAGNDQAMCAEPVALEALQESMQESIDDLFEGVISSAREWRKLRPAELSK